MNEITDPASEPNTDPTGLGLVFAIAGACGIAVANIRYNRPMLSIIERDFPGTSLSWMIPTATQLGRSGDGRMPIPFRF
jgi:hypothetical protein